MSSKMQHCICSENLFQESVVGGKAVMRGCRLAEQKPHRITLITKGRLNSNEDIPKLLAIDKQVVAI